MALEDAHLNQQTLGVMKTSVTHLQKTVNESDLEKADEVMEDFSELTFTINEMNNLMSE
eukprot:CAMPEP_0201581256 /NCGR_PEP_ID=MMETSP0190_2-20130828/64927_1 /ASSEMBLY_ACC=CAM_ASM_000263 /TAXON_ID=37353 /ORGANISM="Rosalina sp." /LENGTH=58 /DNA_ID=CAMNT_0048018811 /DNA_START=23 /DNA_END=196 /DNA_ORIENTATION=-